MSFAEFLDYGMLLKQYKNEQSKGNKRESVEHSWTFIKKSKVNLQDKLIKILTNYLKNHYFNNQ